MDVLGRWRADERRGWASARTDHPTLHADPGCSARSWHWWRRQWGQPRPLLPDLRARPARAGHAKRDGESILSWLGHVSGGERAHEWLKRGASHLDELGGGTKKKKKKKRGASLLSKFSFHFSQNFSAATDAAALRALASAVFGGDVRRAAEAGWPPSASSPCGGAWVGVACDAGGRVTTVMLPRPGSGAGSGAGGGVPPPPSPSIITSIPAGGGATSTSGPPGWLIALASPRRPPSRLPPSIGALTELRVLSLPGRRLRGPLPRGAGVWAGLTRLETLNLAGNLLSGPVPPELAALAQANISLADNGLMGPLPAAFARRLAGTALDVSGNPGICFVPAAASAGGPRILSGGVDKGGCTCEGTPTGAGALSKLGGVAGFRAPPGLGGGGPPPPAVGAGLNAAISAIGGGALTLVTVALLVRLGTARAARSAAHAEAASAAERRRRRREGGGDGGMGDEGGGAGGDLESGRRPSSSRRPAPPPPVIVLSPDGSSVWVARAEPGGAPPPKKPAPAPVEVEGGGPQAAAPPPGSAAVLAPAAVAASEPAPATPSPSRWAPWWRRAGRPEGEAGAAPEQQAAPAAAVPPSLPIAPPATPGRAPIASAEGQLTSAAATPLPPSPPPERRFPSRAWAAGARPRPPPPTPASSAAAAVELWQLLARLEQEAARARAGAGGSGSGSATAAPARGTAAGTALAALERLAVPSVADWEAAVAARRAARRAAHRSSRAAPMYEVVIDGGSETLRDEPE